MDAIDEFNADLDKSVEKVIPPRLVWMVMDDKDAKHKDLRRKFGPIEVCAIFWDRDHPYVKGAEKRKLIGRLIDDYLPLCDPNDTHPGEEDPGAW